MLSCLYLDTTGLDEDIILLEFVDIIWEHGLPWSVIGKQINLEFRCCGAAFQREGASLRLDTRGLVFMMDT